jgi:ankyrin repeat protein
MSGQPLMQAIAGGQMSIVRLLIDHGANVNASRADGISPLFIACELGRPDMCKLLLLRGAGVNSGKIMAGGGTTPLMAAAARGHRVIVRMLLEAGADTTRQHTMDFRTAATIANELGFAAVAADILKFSEVCSLCFFILYSAFFPLLHSLPSLC